MFSKTPLFLKKIIQNVIWEGDKNLPHVALTFDDGPHPVWTPRVLDILDDYGLHASFFLIGEKAKAHPGIVKRIVNEGHTVGCHTMTHSIPILRKDEFYRSEIIESHMLFEKLFGILLRYFRPPHGFFDAKCMREVTALNMKIVLWSQTPEDWKNKKSSDIKKSVLSHIHNGSIVLLHDGLQDRSGSTINALPAILDTGINRGFDFVSLSSLQFSGENDNS